MMAKYPWQSPYLVFNNCPIFFSDPAGLEGEPSKEPSFVPEGAPKNPKEGDSYRDQQGRLWQWLKSDDGSAGWTRLDGTSIQGQAFVGVMDPWISLGIRGVNLQGKGYFSTQGVYRPSLQKTTVLSLVGIMPPLMHHAPFTNFLFMNQLVNEETSLLIQQTIEKSGQK